MKNIFRNTLAAAILMGSTISASAQELKASYFMQTSSFRHQMNPALLDSAYVGIPFLGNINVGVASNMGLKTFIYEYNKNGYDLTTFMNPDVSSSDFLGRLNEGYNRFNVSFGMNIASVAFKGLGGTNLVELNLRSNTTAALPTELFRFMKDAGEKEEYNLGRFGARSTNYMELALGHSHKINDYLTIGGKVKFLVGLAYADMDIKNMNLKMTKDVYEDGVLVQEGGKWTINADAQLKTKVLKSEFEYDNDRNPATTDLSRGQKVKGLEDIGFGIAGVGAAVDLGLKYDVETVKGLTLSAALTDFGFITWKNANRASSKGEYEFDGFNNPLYVTGTNTGDNKLKDQADAIKNDLEKMFSIYDDGKKSKTQMLGATINIGAEYRMAFYDKLSVGALLSSRLDGIYSYTQAMLSAQIRPVKWFELGINGSTTTSGMCWGGMVSFYTKGFNFYVGSDRIIGKVGKQYIPLNNSNANINFGFTIPM